jgi:hypothetical protein
MDELCAFPETAMEHLRTDSVICMIASENLTQDSPLNVGRYHLWLGKPTVLSKI